MTGFERLRELGKLKRLLIKYHHDGPTPNLRLYKKHSEKYARLKQDNQEINSVEREMYEFLVLNGKTSMISLKNQMGLDRNIAYRSMNKLLRENAIFVKKVKTEPRKIQLILYPNIINKRLQTCGQDRSL